MLMLGSALAGCTDEPPQSGLVEPADAYTAIVAWQAGEQVPVVNEAGEEQLPVIYVIAANGDTIDVGVQTSVTEATVDEAVVRFADEVNDSFDEGIDGAPVRDDGVMLAIGTMSDPASTVEVDVDRFNAQNDYVLLSVTVAANDVATDDSTSAGQHRAKVTVATER